DAGVLPVIDAHQLQARPVGAVLADAGALGMADPHVLEDGPAAVEHQEPFIAPPGIDARLGLGVGAEASDREAIGVVAQRVVPAPELMTGMVPDRVANRDLLATVALLNEWV